MTIYKRADSKSKILALYNRQLAGLNRPFQDLYVKTRFGKTHVVEIGNMDGEPLLVFHGGNATTAFGLLSCDFLLNRFHVYAVDTIGHPGKSAEVCLSAKNEDYGLWASDVISGLGFEKMRCYGGSFGAGIIAKLMCAAPERIEKAVVEVPSGIKNAPAVGLIKMIIPMLLFQLTKKDKWLISCLQPMTLEPCEPDSTLFETVKCIMNHVKIKAGMPTDADPEKMTHYTAPTLVIASERDCLFPASLVIPQAKQIIKGCQTYELKGQGHFHYLSQEEEQMIVAFLE